MIGHRRYVLSYPFCHIIFALIFTILLSSCSGHISRSDGPPNFYVDETKIPNATPKPERLAKYGNMPSYVVFGRRYYTMRSSKYYQETGTASWYGTKFHAKRTSSGEPYNMLSMTAAHKTLPLPTYVEVTNLKNRRKIIVKVNDRGPFESNRLIDLSYVAAKKLGMLGHGTAPVAIKAIDPYEYAEENQSIWHFPHLAIKSKQSHAILAGKTTKQMQSSHHFHEIAAADSATFKRLNRDHHIQAVYLQVGAFRHKAHAERLKNRLMTLLPAPIQIYNPTAQSNLYRVKVGPFRDMATAEKISDKLKGIGFKPNKS